MALSITVHPLTPTLDIYGESDPSAAYSLSGHVSISISSSSYPSRLFLQSLSLTFEGQSEVFTPGTGYSSVRLCSITRELAPSERTELSNEGSGETCVWNVIFNLTIPGWLPPTTALDINDIGIRYLLHATAKFTNLSDKQAPWSFASFCTPLRSRLKLVHGQTGIQLRRFISPPRAGILDPQAINYFVDSHDSTSNSFLNKPRIPVHILNKIQILASVPEYVDVKGHILPVTLRIRTKDLCAEDCKRLQVAEVVIDILQREKCRVRPSSRCLLQYPLPPQEMQPPNLPLLDPHSLSFICGAGLFVGNGISESVSRISLLPSKLSGIYKLSEDNYVFANDATPQEVATWYTLEALVPFMQSNPANANAENLWQGLPNILPSLSSPLYSVYHDVSISLTCAFDLPNGETAYEQLNFVIPVTFANVAPSLPLVKSSTPPPAHSASPSDISALSSSSVSYPPDLSSMSADPISLLPAYSQLYDLDGERKIDYSTPLPLYRPRSRSSIRL